MLLDTLLVILRYSSEKNCARMKIE